MNDARLPFDRLLKKRVTPQNDGSEPLSEANEAQLRLDIGRRIMEAYETSIHSHIADRAGLNLTTVRFYSNGSRFPSVEFLYQTFRVTGVSIHWLVTGEGSKLANQKNIFTPEEEMEIGEIARKNKRTFSEEVRRLTNAAIIFIKSAGV